MIVYNKTWLNNLEIQEEATQAYEAGSLSASEYAEIKLKYPVGFYSPGVWVRLGLFILTCIITASCAGLLALMLMDSGALNSPAWVFILTAIFYGGLELITRGSNHYRSGADDALVLITAGTFLTAICWSILDHHNSLSDEAAFQIIGMIMFAACLFLTLRFADTLIAASTAVALLVFIFFSTLRLGQIGQAILPFVMILASALIYFFSYSWYAGLKYRYYSNVLIMVQVVALMALYFSGNYFVVNMLNQDLNSHAGAPSPLPFSLFFWVWTIALPMVYIVFGLKKKDVVLLRSGLLLVAIAAFTIRAYFYLMSMEALLCLCGAVLITIAYGVIRYLKVPKHGFTYEETTDKNLMDNLRVESLIVNETFADGPAVPAESTRFGGGDFGGGGASGNF